MPSKKQRSKNQKKMQNESGAPPIEINMTLDFEKMTKLAIEKQVILSNEQFKDLHTQCPIVRYEMGEVSDVSDMDLSTLHHLATFGVRYCPAEFLTTVMFEKFYKFICDEYATPMVIESYKKALGGDLIKMVQKNRKHIGDSTQELADLIGLQFLQMRVKDLLTLE